MQSYLQQIPYSVSLLSIKGFGVVTVAGLIGEVGDFKKFDTHSEIMKLAGFDLFEVSSGQHQWTTSYLQARPCVDEKAAVFCGHQCGQNPWNYARALSSNAGQRYAQSQSIGCHIAKAFEAYICPGSR